MQPEENPAVRIRPGQGIDPRGIRTNNGAGGNRHARDFSLAALDRFTIDRHGTAAALVGLFCLPILRLHTVHLKGFRRTVRQFQRYGGIQQGKTGIRPQPRLLHRVSPRHTFILCIAVRCPGHLEIRHLAGHRLHALRHLNHIFCVNLVPGEPEEYAVLPLPDQVGFFSFGIEVCRLPLNGHLTAVLNRLFIPDGSSNGTAVGIFAPERNYPAVSAVAIRGPTGAAGRFRQSPAIRQPGRAPCRRVGIRCKRPLADIRKRGAVCSPLPIRFLVPTFGMGVAQQNGFCGGIIPDLHAQQLTDGPDGQIVGLSSGGIGIQNGGRNLLSIGGRDRRPRRNGRFPVYRHVGKIECHLTAGSQHGGSQGHGHRCGQAPGPKG